MSATATLTVANVAPVVSISAPANGSLFARGTQVNFTAPFTDAGRNDSHTCTVNFDDGTPVANGTVTETPNSGTGTCATSHAFTALGPHNVLVTVRDDDGGTGTPIGAGSGQLTIPLVATVFYNQTVTTSDGQLFQHATRVRTLLGQEIILSGCHLG